MTNLEIVKKGYECFGSGDIEGLLELFSDDISWTTPQVENSPISGRRKSKTAVAEFFAQLAELEEFSHFAPTEFISEGDRVVVLGSFQGTVKPTGKQFESDWAHIFTVRDGKVTDFLEFFDNAAVGKAYQLSAAA